MSACDSHLIRLNGSRGPQRLSLKLTSYFTIDRITNQLLKISF